MFVEEQTKIYKIPPEEYKQQTVFFIKVTNKSIGGSIMKAIYFFITTVIVVLTFTACSSSENDSMENEVSFFESIKYSYGIMSASYDAVNKENVPSVTVEEMKSVLDVLYQNSKKTNDCQVTNTNLLGTNGTVAKKVMMTGDYQAKTRSGALLENFALCVELSFNVEKGKVYYLGTTYCFSSDLFEWCANGLSLAPVKGVSGCVYGFESTSYLYFNVRDQGDCLVKVPVAFNGSYNFDVEKGTYNFILSKK